MRTIVKQPKLLIGLGLLIVLLVTVSGWFYGSVNTADQQPRTIQQAQETEHAEGISHKTPSQSQDVSGNRATSHEDRLSQEMKQAIRDKLLFHGPVEVIKHPDGSIELPSNGRFTQMPVAVEMPDGSIQIKEYSVLPE
jgi:hypothetical protein